MHRRALPATASRPDDSGNRDPVAVPRTAPRPFRAIRGKSAYGGPASAPSHQLNTLGGQFRPTNTIPRHRPRRLRRLLDTDTPVGGAADWILVIRRRGALVHGAGPFASTRTAVFSRRRALRDELSEEILCGCSGSGRQCRAAADSRSTTERSVPSSRPARPRRNQTPCASTTSPLPTAGITGTRDRKPSTRLSKLATNP